MMRMQNNLSRTLGRLKAPVGALGLGCWAIGGPFYFGGKPDGWGDIDDRESLRAIQRATDLGIRLFDTADVYGTGHSERILGQALGSGRSQVVIATKFGYTYDEQQRVILGTDVSADYIRQACAASLRRLGTDYIDLYQLHVGSIPQAEAEGVLETLERLCDDGLIRAYGWSTDDPECAKLFLPGARFSAVQHEINVLADTPAMLALCEERQLASLNRAPLAMGLLSGKFNASSTLPSNDVRGAGHTWVRYFREGRPNSEYLQKLAAIREILTSEGRTPVQGALAWIWGRSSQTIPIPGFKTVSQVEELAGAVEAGPLTAGQMQEIQTILQ
jgi:aryl-alcohol dehydrogenase-like predicted oxidoreductase